uniref:Uncharacterized protein n=1 Tax=Plectus sambesii TaxID=2011161 RepID=A0A914UZH9_9BILA
MDNDNSCDNNRVDRIDAHSSLHERALCPFRYVLNYNPKRFPAALTEVQCLCDRPPAKHPLKSERPIECEPLRYQLRVLLFDEECGAFVDAMETIGLACLPVIQAAAPTHAVANIIRQLSAIPET